MKNLFTKKGAYFKPRVLQINQGTEMVILDFGECKVEKTLKELEEKGFHDLKEGMILHAWCHEDYYDANHLIIYPYKERAKKDIKDGQEIVEYEQRKNVILKLLTTYVDEKTLEMYRTLASTGDPFSFQTLCGLAAVDKWAPEGFITEYKVDVDNKNPLSECICAFANSGKGGRIICGVSPDLKTVGIEHDIEPTEVDTDSIRTAILNHAKQTVSGTVAAKLNIEFYIVDSHLICCITLPAIQKGMFYFKDALIVRSQGCCSTLRGQEHTAWVCEHLDRLTA